MHPSLALATNSGPALGNLLILVLPLLLLVFLMMSQRRRGRAAAQLQESLKIGDEVVTTSGLFGKIVALDDQAASLEVSPGVVVRYDKRAIGIRRGVPTSDSGSPEAN